MVNAITDVGEPTIMRRTDSVYESKFQRISLNSRLMRLAFEMKSGKPKVGTTAADSPGQ
ncbi:hypothetical protein PAXRUDRAFT_829105 [Paxillus rubicundulus Ve08.2h10]|uniref:Unplaced genomic scaffold scaffold_375, whole genome shotgun sequence n=1 Tax=Paxillus rubicundulus Ve08.2h10 TaxID=930991 RepID=A0A0D0E6F9_9AGAM|nr:hypothetical protein PAXRUDRAFT_829105 [Paxillus rubicundulus Ve08.2h10]